MERLPSEITTNILARLDFRSTGICKCVSIPWRELLSDPTFPLTQFSQISTVSPDIFLHFKCVNNICGSRMCYLEDIEALKSPLNPFTVLDEHYLANKFNAPYPTILGSSHGLIALLNPFREVFDGHVRILPQNPIYVFNPIHAQYSKLPSFPIPKIEIQNSHKHCDKWLCGFGFEDSRKVFKMVLVIFDAIDYRSQSYNNQVLVHTLGSGTWEIRHGVVPDVLRTSDEIVSLAFVNGSLHWITIDGSSQNKGPPIVSFNLQTEEFGVVPTPDSHVLNYSYRNYQLGLIGEHLSLVECTPYGSFIDIWVMKKYNDKESWVRQFSLENSQDCRTVRIIKLRKNRELLLLCDNQYMVGYNTRNQKSRVLSLGWPKKFRRYKLEAYPLVGSLISLKSAIRMGCDTRQTTSVNGNI